MADFASVAAAVAAGYQIVVQAGEPNGSGFKTVLQKYLTGSAGGSGSLETATGWDINTQAAADAACVASLNAQRSARYGFGEPGGELDTYGQATITDKT